MPEKRTNTRLAPADSCITRLTITVARNANKPQGTRVKGV